LRKKGEKSKRSQGGLCAGPVESPPVGCHGEGMDLLLPQGGRRKLLKFTGKNLRNRTRTRERRVNIGREGGVLKQSPTMNEEKNQLIKKSSCSLRPWPRRQRDGKARQKRTLIEERGHQNFRCAAERGHYKKNDTQERQNEADR